LAVLEEVYAKFPDYLFAKIGLAEWYSGRRSRKWDSLERGARNQKQNGQKVGVGVV